MQGVGDRITLADAGELTWLKATAIVGTDFWRLAVVGTGSASFPKFEAEVPECLKKDWPDVQLFAVWQGVAPRGTATLDYKKPAQADEAKFIQYCQEQIAIFKQYFPDEPHQLAKILLDLSSDLPADQSFQIDDWWLGMPIPSDDGSALKLTLSNDFKWNPKPDATEEQCSAAEKYMKASGCSAPSAEELARKLRQYFSKAHSVLITRAVTKEVFDNAQISDTRPFDVIQMLTVVKQKDTYTEAGLKELIGKLEHAIASMGAIEALKGKAAHIPWPASAKEHQSLLDKLFETTPQSYHLAAVATPVSKDIMSLTGVFGAEAIQLAQDAWFGPKRKPRLDAIRGTAVPTSKEIRHK